MSLLMFIVVILLSIALYFLRQWVARGKLSPQWRRRFESGFFIALALMIMDLAAITLFLATQPPPNAPQTMQILGVLFAMLIPIGLLGFPFLVVGGSRPTEEPAHPQDSSQHHSQPMQLSLVSTVIFVGGLSIAIIGVAGFPTESQPSYHADGYYGAFFTGLCFALVGLSELCRPVLPSAPRFILWAAAACIPPAMWFAVRFLIAQLLSDHL